eukprot:CAMPEP_0203744592 /NCGR_PEP_ID=MMETSP0098-20131031/609_1 /ASSEMBLY_ACC=CAM_ASM_000208 /TAXON_ID=96639 /ORGANISM=" , Strain NY0313808BC1" /LENGTH=523 /DNA_ID=CAMNT_0050632151 /DNA_START=376 /DNA_END=1947 /DNA_ORIENTATION=+
MHSWLLFWMANALAHYAGAKVVLVDEHPWLEQGQVLFDPISSIDAVFELPENRSVFDNSLLGYVPDELYAKICQGNEMALEQVRKLDIAIINVVSHTVWSCSNITALGRCELVPIWIDIGDQYIDGVFHFVNANSKDNWPKHISSCTYLDATWPSDINLEKYLLEGPVHVNMSIDRYSSQFLDIANSTSFFVIYRGFLPLLYWAIVFIAARVAYLRKSCHKLRGTDVAILLINVIQCSAMAVSTWFGCTYFLSDNCSKSVHILFWTQFSGLTLCTNLLFVALLREVTQKLELAGRNRAKAYRKTRICAVLLALVDVLSLVVFAVSEASRLTQVVDVINIVMPYFLFLGQIITQGYLLYSYRRLMRVMEVGLVMPESSGSSSSTGPGKKEKHAYLERLGAVFVRQGKYGIISGTIFLFAVVLYVSGLTFGNVALFFVYVILCTCSNLLNIYSQTMVLWPITTLPGGRQKASTPQFMSRRSVGRCGYNASRLENVSSVLSSGVASVAPSSTHVPSELTEVAEGQE